MKYYVVSDIHGYYNQLIKALKKKGYFKDTGPHKLIICGDLFDRGEQPLQTLEFVNGLLAKDEVILIRGNHEDMLVELADNAYKWFGKNSDVKNTHHWINGTIQTLLSIAGMTLEEASAQPEKLAQQVYNSAFFKNILPAMKNCYETQNYIFVHGWIPCFASGYGGNAYSYEYDPNWREASQQDWYFARWYNGMKAFAQGVREQSKTIVCGHWHASYGHSNFEKRGSEFGKGADFTPFVAEGIMALDACTVASGFINCVVVED